MAKLYGYASVNMDGFYLGALSGPSGYLTSTSAYQAFDYAGAHYKTAVGFNVDYFGKAAVILGGADLALTASNTVTGSNITYFASYTGTLGVDESVNFVLVGKVPVTFFNDAVSGKVSGDATALFTEALKGADTIVLSNDDDTVSGFAGNDNIKGNGGFDILRGGDGNDKLYGGAGDDNLAGEQGDDLLSGGAGSDTAGYKVAIAGVTVDLRIKTAQDTGGAGRDTLSSIENINGSAFADHLTGNNGVNQLLGRAGNDTLVGLGGNDVLICGIGNDTVDGGAGLDTASYSDSTSQVSVSLAITGTQNTGGGGTDTLIGIENLVGSDLNDSLTGDAGNNIIFGSYGYDVIHGGAGNDKLYGNDASGTYDLGDERLYGEAGNDVLVGGFKQDTLDGGTGNDKLFGGHNNDTLTGGTGADQFVLASDHYAHGFDLITDFSSAQRDKIGLSLALSFSAAFKFAAAAGGTLSADEFYAAAGATMAHDASDRIIYNTTTGDLYYDADGTGTHDTIEQIAQLGSGSTHPGLTVGDFLILA